MPVIYPRGVYIVHQLQKISRSLAVPSYFYAYRKREKERKMGLWNQKKKKKKEREKSTAYEKPIHRFMFAVSKKKKTCLRWMWRKKKINDLYRWPDDRPDREKRRKWNRHRLHGSQWTALRQICINDQATFLSTSFCILIRRNMRRVTVGSGVSFIVDFDFASRDHMSKGRNGVWSNVCREARLLEGRLVWIPSIPQLDYVCN